MRTLLLLRHAKSSWDDPPLPDHDRPLAPRGVEAADRIGTYLLAEGIRPSLVLSSSAQRATDTLEALRPALGMTADVHIENDLYGADADRLLRRLRAVDPRVSSVMVIGHNPGVQDLAIALAGDGDEAALLQLRTKFPTAALAMFDLGRSGWARLHPGRAHLTRLVLPRHLSR